MYLDDETVTTAPLPHVHGVPGDPFMAPVSATPVSQVELPYQMKSSSSDF